MSEETKPQKPFPQFIDKNPRKHFHWAMFLIVSLGLAAALLIAIENFKTAEEIDSMAPMPKDQAEHKPKAPEISDWKTYKNEEYGLTLKYPEYYVNNDLYTIWTGEKDAQDSLFEWGVNKGVEPIFIVKVYPKEFKLSGSELATKIIQSQHINSKYKYLIFSSYSVPSGIKENTEYKTILDSLIITK